MKKLLTKLAKLIFSLGLKPIRPKNGSQGFLIYSSLSQSDVSAIKQAAEAIDGWSVVYSKASHNPDGSLASAHAYVGPVKDNSMSLDELIAHSMGD